MLHQAIKQDGWDVFDVCVLANPLSHETLMEMEKIMIAEHGTMAPNGYNMTRGGLGQYDRPMNAKAKQSISFANSGRKPWNAGKATGPLSYAHRQKLSKARRGKSSWNKGIPTKEETKARISDALTGRLAWNAGKKTGPTNLTVEGRRRMSEAKRGSRGPCIVPVIADGVEYCSISEAARALGLTQMQMRYRLKTGRAMRAKGV